MIFSRGAQPEPLADPVPWRDVTRFTVGTVERPQSPSRKRAVVGPLAIRVPSGRVLYTPCAYVVGDRELYEDHPGHQTLICALDAPVEAESGERVHIVRDAAGTALGSLHRVPPKHRLARHTWRIERPDGAPVVGRPPRLSVGEKAAGLGVKAFTGALQMVGDMGAEGGDQGPRPKRASARELEWRVDGGRRAGRHDGQDSDVGKVVMASQGADLVKVLDDGFDRRLAFAFALIGDN
ncbi:hypothetical protein [Yinghuangia seranimata]|uniref:hypothetical protein n=1 Tax=Yinghuangia seranimata TaxID=408067 RepID=UPI00248D1CC4|nr:hypothetical protein [Yinghuangia seranimata]MDI2129800.1 hypothetical protein [Yinghuangia seranimata]